MCLNHRTSQGYTIGNRADYRLYAMDIIKRVHVGHRIGTKFQHVPPTPTGTTPISTLKCQELLSSKSPTSLGGTSEFQAVRAVFEAVIAALATQPARACAVDNQAFTVPDAGRVRNHQPQIWTDRFKVLTGNLERLSGSLVVECYTGYRPARAQEMITPVMQALNDLNSCGGYKATLWAGWAI